MYRKDWIKAETPANDEVCTSSGDYQKLYLTSKSLLQLLARSLDFQYVVLNGIYSYVTPMLTQMGYSIPLIKDRPIIGKD